MGISVKANVREVAPSHTRGQTPLPDSGLRSRSRGIPRPAPTYVYRRNRLGEWEPLAGLDFSSALPRSLPRRRTYSLRRAAVLILLGFLPGGVLWGWSWKLQREVAQQQVEMNAYSEQGVGVIAVQMEVTAQRVSGGKLVLHGRTNLPDGTVLRARVGRNVTVLAHDYPIVVRQSLFQSAPLANRGRSFRPGDYEIELLALFAPTAQSQAVLNWVGPGGKKLTGPLVESSEENETVKVVAFRGGIRLR